MTETKDRLTENRKRKILLPWFCSRQIILLGWEVNRRRDMKKIKWQIFFYFSWIHTARYLQAFSIKSYIPSPKRRKIHPNLLIFEPVGRLLSDDTAAFSLNSFPPIRFICAVGLFYIFCQNYSMIFVTWTTSETLLKFGLYDFNDYDDQLGHLQIPKHD